MKDVKQVVIAILSGILAYLLMEGSTPLAIGLMVASLILLFLDYFDVDRT